MAETTPKRDLSAFERPKRCVLAKWIDSELDAADRDTLSGAWDSHLTAYAIHAWLEERDNPFTEQTTWRHRMGRCACRPRRKLLKEAA